MTQSAVQFATKCRVHMGLAVASVEQSTAFYQTLFEVKPTKTRPGYARFEVADLLLNLSIIQTDQAKGHAETTSHFGIQVQSTAAVDDMRRKLESAGLEVRVEDSVNCCHAVQDKLWVVDPDGHRWEVFVVLDDAPMDVDDPDNLCCGTSPAEPCCSIGGEPCCSEND